MNASELKNLLARAAAALETPDDVTPQEVQELAEDLRAAEQAI